MLGDEIDLIVDLTDAKGNVIPGKVAVQSPAMPKLDHDLAKKNRYTGWQAAGLRRLALAADGPLP
jgi:hypothetical protein